MARAAGPSLDISLARAAVRGLQAELRHATGQVRKGAVRALRRSLRSGATEANKVIRQEINLRAKVVRERISTKVLSQREVSGSVTVRDKRVPLSEFMSSGQLAREARRWKGAGSRGPAWARQKRHVLRIKTFRRLAPVGYPGHFVEQGRRSRKFHVMSREGGLPDGEPRLRYGPSIVEPFAKALPAFTARAADVLERNLEHEIGFVLGRFDG